MGLDIDGRLSPSAVGECRRAARDIAGGAESGAARGAPARLAILLDLLASASGPDEQRAAARRLLAAAARGGNAAAAKGEAYWRLVDALLPLLGPDLLYAVPTSRPAAARTPADILAQEHGLPGGRIDLAVVDGTTTATREIPFEWALEADPRAGAVVDAWAARQGRSGIVRLRGFDPLAAADRIGDRVHLIGCATDDPLGFPIVHNAGDGAGKRYGWRPASIGEIPIPALRDQLAAALAPATDLRRRPRLQRVRVSGPGVDMDYHRLILPLHVTARTVGALAVAVLSIGPPDPPPKRR
jgi:hypothetical protein